MERKLIIFDMDGLMFDTERINGDALIAAAKTYGYEISYQMRLKMLGRSKKDNGKLQLDTFGQDYPLEEIRSLASANKQLYLEEYGLPVKDGLYELLAYLQEN